MYFLPDDNEMKSFLFFIHVESQKSSKVAHFLQQIETMFLFFFRSLFLVGQIQQTCNNLFPILIHNGNINAVNSFLSNNASFFFCSEAYLHNKDHLRSVPQFGRLFPSYWSTALE